MSKNKMDLLQGTLDLLILKAMKLGPCCEWSKSARREQLSAETSNWEKLSRVINLIVKPPNPGRYSTGTRAKPSRKTMSA